MDGSSTKTNQTTGGIVHTTVRGIPARSLPGGHDGQDNRVAAATVWSAGEGRPGLLEAGAAVLMVMGQRRADAV